MTKEQKAKVIGDTVERLQRASGLYLADFAYLTVEKANHLRGEFFRAGVDYKVIKNTLLKRALQDVGGYDDIMPYLVGQTGVVFTYDDPIAPARLLKTFIKDNEKMLSVKACVIGEEVFDGSRLEELANLPTHEELIASIIGSIAAPSQGIVGAIHGVMSGLVYAIDAIEKQKQDQAA
ncbi:MAG: 50S ribosomal protein L10 [Bacteroidetes bacterium]|nr:50S ribosomal protein L10 [Bacteroidota bacterium]